MGLYWGAWAALGCIGVALGWYSGGPLGVHGGARATLGVPPRVCRRVPAARVSVCPQPVCPQPVCPCVRVSAARVSVCPCVRVSVCPCPPPPWAPRVPLPPRVPSHACERARPCAPVRSHPSPAARGARVSRRPCAGRGCRGGVAAPQRPPGASLGPGPASTIPPRSSPPSRLHPGRVPAPSGHPRAAAGRWWPGALTRAAARPGPPERLRSPLPAEPVPAGPGQELPNPSACSRRFPNQFRAAPALHAFALSESFLRGHLHNFGGFFQGIVTLFQRLEGEKQPKPELRKSCFQTPFPGASSVTRSTLSVSGVQ
ncbi:uncharacterized protein LOC135403606 [Pseudopipra pipra]|uniref:uncharacterized protein LOC135403606 n=1 Tax=Pseudopipra pipra TaxID=415032 RepID=UPI0031397C6D